MLHKHRRWCAAQLEVKAKYTQYSSSESIANKEEHTGDTKYTIARIDKTAKIFI